MKPDRLTQKSQEALQDAHERARLAGNPELLPEHLLAALVEQADGIVPALLSKAGADAEAIQEKVAEELERAPRKSGGPEPFLSRRLRQVMDDADSHAKDAKDEYVSTEHLLLAILDEKDGAASRVLRANGADPAAVRAALKSVRGTQRVTDPTPEG